MQKFISHLKQIDIRRILSVVILGIALLFTTACNNGSVTGARPNNPPVQMGGNNNPHTMGGDGMTDYKMTTDPKAVNQRSDVAQEPITISQLLGTATRNTDTSKLLYSDENQGSAETKVNRPAGKNVIPPPSFPAEPQRVIDRSNPDEGIMEGIGRQFRESTKFLKEEADSAVQKSVVNEEAKTKGASGEDTIFRKSH